MRKGGARSRLLQGRSKGGGDQDSPKTPPGPPRRAPDLPKGPPGPPPDAPRCPPGPLRTTNDVFRNIWPNDLFRKNRKSRTRRKKVEEKKRQRSSTVVTRKRLFRSTWPKIFVRKIRKNKPRLFAEGALCAAVVGKIQKFEIVEKMSKKKSTTVIHGGHSTQSLTKTESLFTTVEHRGWRRWSREALFNINKYR